jgi:hypothetical protein
MRDLQPSLAVACLAVASLLPAACTTYGDGAYAQRQHRIESERRAADMRLATQQTRRGVDLGSAALLAALPDTTWVQRYLRFPTGQRGDYRLYRHFAPDGRLAVVDNWLEPSGSQAEGDWWRVEDDGRLCTLHQRFSHTPSCYRLARRSDGALQVYIDQPGSPYHGLLTMVIAEILPGPPPVVESVLQNPE